MIRIATLWLSVVLAAACSDGTGINADVAGTYELRTFNGQNLPVFRSEFQGVRFDLLSSRLVIFTDATFTERQQLRITQGTLVAEQEVIINGTWTADGRRVTLTAYSSSGATQTIPGSWDGAGQLTFTSGSDVFVYRK